MQKVKLVRTKEINNLKTNEDVVKDLYAGLHGQVIIHGNSDGVYYITNFPKDNIYFVKSDDSLNSVIGLGFKVEAKDIYEGNIIIKEKESIKSYVVKPLDNLTKISQKFNIAVSSLMTSNNLKSDKLFVGQKLIIDD